MKSWWEKNPTKPKNTKFEKKKEEKKRKNACGEFPKLCDIVD